MLSLLFQFYGIPQHFGLFYAMGAALIIEGILSASYHLCPNRYNFQFGMHLIYCYLEIIYTCTNFILLSKGVRKFIFNNQ